MRKMLPLHVHLYVFTMAHIAVITTQFKHRHMGLVSIIVLDQIKDFQMQFLYALLQLHGSRNIHTPWPYRWFKLKLVAFKVGHA